MGNSVVNHQLFIYPTDTVWGIGASIYSQEAHQQMAMIKEGRDRKPLSLLFANWNQLSISINFPSNFNRRWLEKLFSLESTLLIPLEWMTCEVPPWIIFEEKNVGIRFLTSSGIAQMVESTRAPISTTSLNLSGQPPICDRQQAIEFRQKYCPQAVLVDDANLRPSGQSSTLVIYRQGHGPSLQILRRGRFAQELEKHGRLLLP